jgi:hypothetical protein
MRALTWDHVDLDGDPSANPPVPPSIEVWRSVRESGDTRTKKVSTHAGAPPALRRALRLHQQRQSAESEPAGAAWKDNGLVFARLVGTAMDASHVRRSWSRRRPPR